MPDVQDPSSGSPEAPLDPADQAVANGDQAAFKEVRLAQRAGKPIPQVAPSAESAPAPPVEQAVSTETSPKAASEPAKPKKNAETRIQELLAERDSARSEVARLKALEQRTAPPDVKPAESSPAKPSTRDWERYEAMPDAPKLPDYDNFERWNIDMAAFAGRKEAQELLSAHVQKQQQDAEEHRYKEAEASSYAKGKAEYPDFSEAIEAARSAGRQWPADVIDFAANHEYGYRVAYALAKADDSVYARIRTPIGFGMYAAEVLAKLNAPQKQPQKTNAPDPPFTLGTRPHDSTDAEESAVENGDQYAFSSARRRRLAASQR